MPRAQRSSSRWAEGGTGYEDALAAIAADPVRIERFVDASMDLIDVYGLDGMDMDSGIPGDAAGFALMHALSMRLHEAGKELSVAVSATSFTARTTWTPSLRTSIF